MSGMETCELRELRCSVEYDYMNRRMGAEQIERDVKHKLSEMLARELEQCTEFLVAKNIDRGVLKVEARIRVAEPGPKPTLAEAIQNEMIYRDYSERHAATLRGQTVVEMADGNPGALKFAMEAYAINITSADRAFLRMGNNGISGSKLYMLWNDCCGRDTRLALQIAQAAPIDKIVEHINYEGGRGFPFTAEELAGLC